MKKTSHDSSYYHGFIVLFLFAVYFITISNMSMSYDVDCRYISMKYSNTTIIGIMFLVKQNKTTR